MILCLKRTGENDVEWTGWVAIRKAQFVAVGEASKLYSEPVLQA